MRLLPLTRTYVTLLAVYYMFNFRSKDLKKFIDQFLNKDLPNNIVTSVSKISIFKTLLLITSSEI